LTRVGRAHPAVRVIHREITASTNTDALERARAGEQGPLWVVAREQTGGRGRRGRRWHSPPGNLYASHLLVDPCAAEDAPQLGFLAGVALVDAVRAATGLADVGLKWPNDLLVGAAKAAGILLDASRLPDGRLVCVIGIGVNCRSHPDDLPYRATHLSAAAERDVPPEDLFGALAEAVDLWTRRWRRGGGFAQIRDAWLDRAAGIGTPVEIVQHEAILRGTFETIDATGRMIVATERGRITVDAGDVRFPGGFESLAMPAMR
jgi:BirA family biotin operon repressor/biotin-[acetyl-CoA-carboxylase] ligase